MPTGQVTLSWTNSTSSDFTRTIVRYRTDGKFPVSPVDGFAVTTKTGAPGSSDSFVHTGLTNGTTYSYGAVRAGCERERLAGGHGAGARRGMRTPPANVNNLRRSDRH